MVTMFELVRVGGSPTLTAASPETKRIVVKALCAEVFQQVPIDQAASTSATLNAGQYGDSPFRQSLRESAQIAEAESALLGEEYDDTNQTDVDLGRRAYARHQVAMAYYAAYHALDPNPEHAVYLTAYHARQAIGWDAVLPIVNQALTE